MCTIFKMSLIISVVMIVFEFVTLTLASGTESDFDDLMTEMKELKLSLSRIEQIVDGQANDTKDQSDVLISIRNHIESKVNLTEDRLVTFIDHKISMAVVEMKQEISRLESVERVRSTTTTTSIPTTPTKRASADHQKCMDCVAGNKIWVTTTFPANSPSTCKPIKTLGLWDSGITNCVLVP